QHTQWFHIQNFAKYFISSDQFIFQQIVCNISMISHKSKSHSICAPMKRIRQESFNFWFIFNSPKTKLLLSPTPTTEKKTYSVIDESMPRIMSYAHSSDINLAGHCRGNKRLTVFVQFIDLSEKFFFNCCYFTIHFIYVVSYLILLYF